MSLHLEWLQLLARYTDRNAYPIGYPAGGNSWRIIGEVSGTGGTQEEDSQAARDIVRACQLFEVLRGALDQCKAAAENKSLPPSARLELVRDYATPALDLAKKQLEVPTFPEAKR